MFAVIYKFYLENSQIDVYKGCWNKVTKHFIQYHGAIGSCLHKGNDNLWIAYSRWPDKDIRDKVWSNDSAIDQFPPDIKEAIKQMYEFKQINEKLGKFEELCLDIVDDLLVLE